jgi:hypothetical protein
MRRFLEKIVRIKISQTRFLDTSSVFVFHLSEREYFALAFSGYSGWKVIYTVYKLYTLLETSFNAYTVGKLFYCEYQLERNIR